jgi:glucosamine-phosphate N-acetyltransferase
MSDINFDNLIFRKLTINDYISFLELIRDFRDTTFTEEMFITNLNKIMYSSDIYILEYNNKLIATGTVIYETKFIFNICALAHIEDICVKMEYRNQGLGKYIVNKLVNTAKENKCYKITLDCADTNVAFYEKCNFEKRGNQMTVFFGINK